MSSGDADWGASDAGPDSDGADRVTAPDAEPPAAAGSRVTELDPHQRNPVPPAARPQVDRVDTGFVDEDPEPALFSDRRRILQTLAIVIVLIAAIYILVPKLAGIEDGVAKMGDGDWSWIALAVGFNVLAFASYVALFRGVVGEKVIHLDWRESYQITMAGLAATRLLSAGGAGGIALTYWALRKAGMERKQSATRMVAFLVVLYAVYVLAVLIGGILLRVGVLPGPAPVSMTIVPAAIAGAVIAVALLVALIPGDLQRRLSSLKSHGLIGRLTHKAATVPATLATGIRTAIQFMRSPQQGGLAVLGAIGFWAANIGILWASFEAFDLSVPVGVLVVGFFVGMAANLAPAPAGVGAVDGGMIGAFLIFKLPAETVIAAVLVYRLIAFWLPVPPGVIAFLQLRKTVERWNQERREGRRGPVGEAEPAAAGQSLTS